MTNITSTPGTEAIPTAGAPAKSAGRKPDTKRELKAFSGLAHVALIAWALVTAGPLLWVLFASF